MLTHKHSKGVFLISILVVLALDLFTPIAIDFYLYLIIIGLFLFAILLGSFNIRLNYFLKNNNNTTRIKNKVVAITFDDGPHPENTPQILALLKKHNATAAFFCIGKHLEQHPLLLQDIVNQGHIVGNHTYTHSPYFGFFTSKKVSQEILKTNELIQKIIGKKLAFFRPPYGVTNPAIAKALKKTGLHSIGWNIRSLDTIIKDETAILKRITRRIAPGSVILLHENQPRSILVLEQLLIFMQKNGYKTVSLEVLFNKKPYA